MSAVALGAAIAVFAADPPKQEPMRLWEKDAPGAKGQKPMDIPAITPYFPENRRNFPCPQWSSAPAEPTADSPWDMKGIIMQNFSIRMGLQLSC